VILLKLRYIIQWCVYQL